MLDHLREFVTYLKINNAVKPLYKLIVPLLVRDKLSREFVNPYSELEICYKVIFVHIPKNAGNGFAKSVFNMKPKGHNFLRNYKKNDIDKYNSYFKFSILRDVHSRFYSAFCYLKKGGFGVYDIEFRDKYLKDLNFDEFIFKLRDDVDYRREIMSWTHFIPQVDFILVNGKCELDYLGSVEDIDSAMSFLSSRLGLESFHNLIENSSNSRNFDDPYTAETKDLVSQFYSKDIDLLFHYKNNYL